MENHMEIEVGRGFEAGPEKQVYLETFGCQMNDDDSSRILGFLKEAGYGRTCEPMEADLIIINTCSVRDKAEQKVYSTLGRFRELKKERPGLMIAVSGCVAQQEGEALLKRAPYLDMVFGPHNIHRLKGLLNEASAGRRRVAATELSRHIGPDEYGRVRPGGAGFKASVSIMRGCDNFCSYCIVPYTRGREVSRRSADIVEEIKMLVDGGVAEVNLLGQNVNSYGTSGGGDVTFPALLRGIAGIEGIKRLRFITSHPKDISDELIMLFNEEPRLCRHMHLPVQSGSDAVLKRMKRGYTVDEYLSKVMRLKELYRDMAVTTDVIVGFPGETDEDFEATMELVKTVRFDNIFSFMYSPRPKTLASGYDGQIDAGMRSRRLRILQETQREITAAKNRELIGKRVEILIEGESKAGPEDLMGRTGCNRIVNFSRPAGDLRPGGLMDVVITDAFANSLRGTVLVD